MQNSKSKEEIQQNEREKHRKNGNEDNVDLSWFFSKLVKSDNKKNVESVIYLKLELK